MWIFPHSLLSSRPKPSFKKQNLNLRTNSSLGCRWLNFPEPIEEARRCLRGFSTLETFEALARLFERLDFFCSKVCRWRITRQICMKHAGIFPRTINQNMTISVRYSRQWKYSQNSVRTWIGLWRRTSSIRIYTLIPLSHSGLYEWSVT